MAIRFFFGKAGTWSFTTFILQQLKLRSVQ